MMDSPSILRRVLARPLQMLGPRTLTEQRRPLDWLKIKAAIQRFVVSVSFQLLELVLVALNLYLYIV